MSMIDTAYAKAFPAVVQAVAGTATRTGTLTASSTAVTGLSTTADLAVGIPVYGNGVPDGTVIAAIVSSSAITLSQAATESGSRSLTFPTDALLTQLIAAAQQTLESWIGYPVEEAAGHEYYSGEQYPDLVLKRRPVYSAGGLEVRVDPTGYWGQAPSSFGTDTIQTIGVDYALILERSLTAGSEALLRGNAGILRRLSGGGLGWPVYGGGLSAGYRGTLTGLGCRGAGWPAGDGNIKVTYTAGWSADNMPADLKQACVELVAFLAAITPTGGQAAQSESLGKYSYSLGAVTMASVAGNALAAAGELGSVRQILSRYRDLAI